ncbi:MAG: hypothetical protein K1Y36_17955 [Blastocatellia bacterium]|nr:hypothetical protein [Blastocatellia bacterium]
MSPTRNNRHLRLLVVTLMVLAALSVSLVRNRMEASAHGRRTVAFPQEPVQISESDLPDLRTEPRLVSGAIHSSPMALNNSDSFLWVVNPDNNSVSILDVRSDTNTKVREIPVGKEPQSLAFNADNSKVYVANAVDGTVSVISTSTFTVTKTIPVGVEPWALAFTPNGTKLYVSNSSSRTVSVINPTTDTVTKTIDIPNAPLGERTIPRALAISNNGDFNDNDEKVYVCNFLGEDVAGKIIGTDDYKQGRVNIISTSSDAIAGSIILGPLTDTGFRSDGAAIQKVPPKGNNVFEVTTGAFPNQLAGFFIKGNRAYVPSQGASPEGPVRFNVILQPLVSVVDLAAEREIGQPFNANRGFQFEPTKDVVVNGQTIQFHRFHTIPFDLAFKNKDNVGYLVLGGSDCILRVELDASGIPTVNAPKAAGDAGNFERILVGKNPRAMVINGIDTRGYVWNYVSRDVTVVDLTKDARKENNVIGTIAAASLPSPGTPEGIVQLGKELFNTTIGPMQKRASKNNVLEGAMADFGWCGCYACHPQGLSDGVVWMFPDGPRRSIPLNQTFNPRDPKDQRILNWSAVRDEVQDFELNTRAVAGGQGLILNPDGTPAADVFNLVPRASSGRDPRQDAINEYCKTIRSPLSPVAATDKDAVKGRALFEKSGCVDCHKGGKWTISKLDFGPPPPADRVSADGEITSVLKKVGTHDLSRPNEVIGTGANISKPSKGAAGFNPPSLLSTFILGPYLHDGSAQSLDKVLSNATHVGTKGQKTVGNAKKRAQLIRFLESIDARTDPFQ